VTAGRLTDASNFIRPADADAVAVARDRWQDRARSLPLPEDGLSPGPEEIANLIDRPDVRPLIDGVFGASPFLTDCLLKEQAFVARMLDGDPDDCLAALLAEVMAVPQAKPDRRATMSALRIARRRIALLTALCDISGVWSLAEVTWALTRFADASLDAAVRHLMTTAETEGLLAYDPDGQGAVPDGFTILGMGKLGSGELNYSSDVDLVLLYEPDRCRFPGRLDDRGLFQRMSRDLVTVLQERTSDGYVHRVDLRLRPDPASTPPALSVDGAIAYYESVGQNWERAAMIKARPCAGDLALGGDFLREIEPFIWRRHLDFAAIEDIHAVKRQIDRHRGNRDITVAGHNIKTGRGGIREIEFHAQSLQLVWGARDRRLRIPDTRRALAALADAGRLEPARAERLIEAYGFLRMVEHRLQMLEDHQTQTLPSDEPTLHRLALFCGFEDTAPFAARLTDELKGVRDAYDRLFEAGPAARRDTARQQVAGNLVFTGGEDDPETLETLQAMGFGAPAHVAETVRRWHRGRYRATRTERSQQILTRMMPRLLKALAQTSQPDTAFTRFDAFLSNLPAGVQLFSLFESNPALLDLVAEVMGTAPALAEHLSRYPILFDAVLSDDFYDDLPPLKDLATSLDTALSRGRDAQDYLDIARRWAADRRFQIGVQLLRGITDGVKAGIAFADIAEAVLRALTPRIETAFAFGEGYGRIPGGALAIVGLGRLGAREMNPGSDLDLVFVYDVQADDPVQVASDGRRSLAAPAYYARLAQRVVSALSVPTGEGKLYEIDMRLRPAGNQGPVAVSEEGYLKYLAEEAWTWEQQALTRARVVQGPNRLAGRLERGIAEILRRRRDHADLASAVMEMRTRIAKAKPARSFWDIKNCDGGLTDLDFLVQALVLLHAADHETILKRSSAESLAALAQAGILSADETSALIAADRLWLCLVATLRLTLGDRVPDDPPDQAVSSALCRAAGCDGLAPLRSMIESARRCVSDSMVRCVSSYARTTETDGDGQSG